MIKANKNQLVLNLVSMEDVEDPNILILGLVTSTISLCTKPPHHFAPVINSFVASNQLLLSGPLCLVWFYGISTIVGYLMPNPLYTYILNIYDLVWFGWVLWHINHCRLFNAKSLLCMYIKYI